MTRIHRGFQCALLAVGTFLSLLGFRSQGAWSNDNPVLRSLVAFKEDIPPGENVGGFSACLLTMEDNHRMAEWLAYYWYTLNLEYLVIVVDPRAREHPTDFLDRWRDKMTIIEWTDEDYLPACYDKIKDQRSDLTLLEIRQQQFYKKCAAHMKQAGRTWVSFSDADEYPAINGASVVDAKDRMKEKGSVLKMVEDLRDGNVPAIGNEEKAHFNQPCVRIPRTYYSAVESTTKVANGLGIIPSTTEWMDFSNFDTLRWNYPIAWNKLKKYVPQSEYKFKSFLDVSRLSDEDLKGHGNGHVILDTVCSAKPVPSNYSITSNHYLGSEESFFRRDDIRKSSSHRRDKYRATASVSVDKPVRGIQTWVQGFIETVGDAKARELLSGAGQMFPLRPRVSNDREVTVMEETKKGDEIGVVYPECYLYPHDYWEVSDKYRHRAKSKKQPHKDEKNKLKKDKKTKKRLPFHQIVRDSYAPMNFIERKCPAPNYKTISETGQNAGKICLSTLTDEKASKDWNGRSDALSMTGLLDLGWENKAKYAAKHGYFLYDGSPDLDLTRPASWSKNRAVRRLLEEENCDWVFWVDADAVIMDSTKRLEDILPADSSKHILFAGDGRGDFSLYNAGVWVIRNSPWSYGFLDKWWGMPEFISPLEKYGNDWNYMLSGDNAALKHLLRHNKELHNGILSPPCCSLQSYLRIDLEEEKLDIDAQIYMERSYFKGDFLAHAAGYHDKMEAMKLLLSWADGRNHNKLVANNRIEDEHSQDIKTKRQLKSKMTGRSGYDTHEESKKTKKGGNRFLMPKKSSSRRSGYGKTEGSSKMSKMSKNERVRF